MAASKVADVAGKKRKRHAEEITSNPPKASRTAPAQESEIQRLETEISESRRNFNNIAKLLDIARLTGNGKDKPLAIAALCRVFSRLYVEGHLQNASRDAPSPTPSEKEIQAWLLGKLKQYADLLVEQMGSSSGTDSALAVAYSFQLVKHQLENDGLKAWTDGLFSKALMALLPAEENTSVALAEFKNTYLSEYDDVRWATCQSIAVLGASISQYQDRVIEILLSLGLPPSDDEKIVNFFWRGSAKHRKTTASRKSHIKMAQQAWLAVLGSGLNRGQRNQVLKAMTASVVPWFSAPERLMDFLTDSFDAGDETSLLALSGLFYLIQERNLDYPSFYTKLYSLLTPTLLSSKHRSRFFRLLDTFLASTHLPAAMVASFIKRLSRLALHSPPAAIVWIVPWVYNLFKRHPTCTFMMHREPRSEKQREEWETFGVDDCFDMKEPDPLKTGAIDSDVWELVTLQSHYHPNVATLARIISEQFTKESYNLEDFLDHSYDSLLGPELDREPKKSAVVEYEIPKTILSNPDEPFAGLLGSILQSSR